MCEIHFWVNSVPVLQPSACELCWHIMMLPTSLILEIRGPGVFTWGFPCRSQECLFTGKRCLRDLSEKFQRDPVQHPVALLQLVVSGKRQDSANTSKRNPGVCKQEDSRGKEKDRQGLWGLMRLLATGKEERNSTGRWLPSYPREEVR